MAQVTKSEPARASILVPIGDQSLQGDLRLPAGAPGIVLFAHGSGSSRHSPRNQYVARAFESRALATLLIDLLTPAEEAIDDCTAQYRFDIPMLAGRLATIVDWMRSLPETTSLPVGLFGASTGGGAALMAAAARPLEVAAVVSREEMRRPRHNLESDLGAHLPHRITVHLNHGCIQSTHDQQRWRRHRGQ